MSQRVFDIIAEAERLAGIDLDPNFDTLNILCNHDCCPRTECECWDAFRHAIENQLLVQLGFATEIHAICADCHGYFDREYLSLVDTTGHGEVIKWYCEDCKDRIRATFDSSIGHIIESSVKNHPNFRDLTSKVFGRWLVLHRAPNRRQLTYYLCRCTCGVEREVVGSGLTNGDSRSCGCLSRELSSIANTTHGETLGRSPSPEYASFHSAKGRCENPGNDAYHHYGGRGIEFRFESVQQLIDCIGRRPTLEYELDRFPDNNGHYEPGNVRWATRKEQNRNARSNRLVTAFGKTQCVTEWVEELGIGKELILGRLELGWCAECTLTLKPLKGRARKKGECACSHQTDQPASVKRGEMHVPVTVNKTVKPFALTHILTCLLLFLMGNLWAVCWLIEPGEMWAVSLRFWGMN